MAKEFKIGDRVKLNDSRTGNIIELMSNDRAMISVDGQQYPVVRKLNDIVLIIGIIDELLPIVERIAKRIISWFKKEKK